MYGRHHVCHYKGLTSFSAYLAGWLIFGHNTNIDGETKPSRQPDTKLYTQKHIFN
jgi:hypothetical protein